MLQSSLFEKWFALVCLFGLVWLACIVLLCMCTVY